VTIKGELESRGFGVRTAVVGVGEAQELLEAAGLGPDAPHAARNLLWTRPSLGLALRRLGLDALASEALGAEAFPINALFFDKPPEANWKVPAHQDLMMPVEAEVPTEPGFTGWTSKAGVVHVEPPVDVLEALVALRIHFDGANADNGALAVVPGSHLQGKLRDADLIALAPEQFVACEVVAGDVLLIKPLIVHRSSPSVAPSHRRVLHVAYASREPGRDLRWKRSAPPPGAT
jgi:hypothetical protein